MNSKEIIDYLSKVGMNSELEKAILTTNDKHRICHAWKYYGGSDVNLFEDRLIELDAFVELIGFHRPYMQLRRKFNNSVHPNGYHTNVQKVYQFVENRFCAESRLTSLINNEPSINFLANLGF
jgi:hypothetical protein